MQRNELQHFADFLAHAFTDHSLVWDYQLLSQLGSGVVWIDVLGGDAFFTGQPLAQLFTRRRLQSEFHLEVGPDPATLLDEANVKVRFKTEQHDDQRDLNNTWTHPTGRFVSCLFECRSRVSAGGVTVTGRHSETLEWPYPFWTPTAPELARERLSEPK